uniref:Uncharacterized protein n=1 Tax=Parascaris univalens TaxID=6257 RepID=A0A915A2H7_PARUN
MKRVEATQVYTTSRRLQQVFRSNKLLRACRRRKSRGKLDAQQRTKTRILSSRQSTNTASGSAFYCFECLCVFSAGAPISWMLKKRCTNLRNEIQRTHSLATLVNGNA